MLCMLVLLYYMLDFVVLMLRRLAVENKNSTKTTLLGFYLLENMMYPNFHLEPYLFQVYPHLYIIHYLLVKLLHLDHLNCE